MQPWSVLSFGVDERTKQRARYNVFVGVTPIALFFGGIGSIGIVRALVSGTSVSLRALVAGISGLLASLLMFRWRPKVAVAQAWRFVLVLLGVLVAAAIANVLVVVFLRDLTLAGAIYIAGFVLEFIVGNRLLRKAGFLPIQGGTR